MQRRRAKPNQSPGRHLAAWFAVLLVLVGCGRPTPPMIVPSSVAAPAHRAPLTGRVLGPDGRPVPNVEVTAYFTNGTPFTNATPFRNADVQTVQVRSGADGRFSFDAPPAGPLNLEAVQSEDLKALRLQVAVQAGGTVDVGDLVLEGTGTLVGRVTAPEAPQVTNFLGTDVYVPGTGYLAKTDADGRFTIAHVAAGTVQLVADNRDLGRCELDGVQVVPKTTTTTANLPLSLVIPTITALKPAIVAPGGTVEIDGTNFGQSAGKPVTVNFGGLVATQVDRRGDSVLVVGVPSAAGTGRVVVTVGSVPSGSDATLTVLKGLALTPTGPVLLPVGGTLQLAAAGNDTAGAPVADPPVSWTSADAATASVDGGGRVAAVAPGEVAIAASLGSLAPATLVEVAPVVGQPVPIGTGAEGVGRLPLAGGATGALALWTATEGPGAMRVAGQAIGLDGGAPATVLPLPTAGAPADPAPALAAGADGLLAAWARPNASGSFDLVAQRLAVDGSALGAATPVTLARPGVASTAAALSDGTAVGLVVWQEPDGRLLGQLTSAGTASAPLVLASAGTAPAVSWDGTAFLVAWQDARNGNADIYARRVATTGALAPEVPICTDPADQGAPAVATGGGATLVTWSDRRAGGNAAIWGQRLVGGNPVGPSFPLDAPGAENRPTVAWTGHAFLVAWEDVRHGVSGVFGRELGADGTFASSTFALVLGGPPSGPALARLGSGLVLGWQAPGGQILAIRVKP